MGRDKISQTSGKNAGTKTSTPKSLTPVTLEGRPFEGTITQKGKQVKATVQVKSDAGYGFSDIDVKMIVSTVLEGKELHKTSVARNCPSGSIGYIHNLAENTLWAVKSMNEDSKWIHIIAKGDVNGGVHKF